MKQIILGIISFLIFFIGLRINAIWLHSQNKSYAQMIRNHLNNTFREPIFDTLFIVLCTVILGIPYLGIVVGLAINIVIFMEWLRE